MSGVKIEVYYADPTALTNTSIPGYEIISSPTNPPFHFNNAGGWADVRCPVGKVPFRAKIIQNSDEVRSGGYTVYEDFAVFIYAF